MDFFLPEDHLQRAVPEETRITSLTAAPYPDGYRLHVNIEMTPFQQRPHLEVVLRDADNEEIASTSIIEPLGWKLEFTMHIRGELNNPYTLEARLFYPDGPAAETQTFTFEVKPPDSPGEPDAS
jgi:nitrogen fixation protein